MIDGELLSLLVCPACKGPLEPATAGPEEEPEEELLCRACALAYPVRDGIPMLVREDARPLMPEKDPR